MLKTCAGCGTRYAWSLNQCPNDGNVNYLENGEVVDVLETVSTAITGTLVVGHSAQVDASGASCDRTLPLAASAGVGKRMIVRKVDSSANAVIINRDGSDTVDDGTSYSLTSPGEGVELVSDGATGWLVVRILTIDPILDSIFLSKASDGPARFYGTVAELATRGIPGPGVQVYETDTRVARVGDGVTAITSLSQVGSGTFGSLQNTLAPRMLRPRTAMLTMIQTFQSGHGWTSPGSTWNVADTTDPVIGTQHVSCTTSATSASEIGITGLAPIDLSDKHLAMLIKVDSIIRISGINVYAGDAGYANFTNFTAVHNNSQEYGGTIMPGVWTWVYFNKTASSIGAGTGGLSAVVSMKIRCAAALAGTAATVKVQAIGYFTPPIAYPNGVVSVTFDDGFASQATLAAPYMTGYGQKGNAYIIVDNLGTANQLTQGQLDNLHDACGWEVCGHAYTQANHDVGFSALSDAVVEQEMQSLKTWLIGQGYRGIDHFAYPRGMDSINVAAITEQYFASGRGIGLANATYPQPSPECGDMPLRIRALMVGYPTAPSVVTGMIDAAYAAGAWLILGFHDIVASGAASGIQYNIADFQTISDYIQTKNIPCRTITEVMQDVGVI